MRLLVLIASNTAFQLLGKIFTALGTLLVMGLVARTYGPIGTGIFTLAVVFLAPFTLVVDFGLNARAIRTYTKDDSGSAFSTLLTARLIIAFIALIAVSLLAVLLASLTITRAGFPREFVASVFILAPTLLTFSIYQSALSIFQWKLKYVRNLLALMFGTLALIGTVLALLRLHLPVVFVASAYLISSTVTAGVSFFLIRPWIKQLSGGRLSDVKKEIIGVLPFALVLIFNTLYFRLDTFLLSAIHGIEISGHYNLAYAVFANILVLPTYIMNVLYPILLSRKNTARYRVFVGTVACGMVGAGFMVMAVALVGAPFFMTLWLGDGFATATHALKLLVLSIPIFFATALLMWVLVTAEKYWLLLQIYMLGLVVNAVGNLVLIPEFSYQAAAIMTLIGECTIFAASCFLVIRNRAEILV